MLRQDPTPLTNLLLHLLSTTTFSEILLLTEQTTILQTLCAPSLAIQQLGLSILQKATVSVSDAGIVASWNDVIKKLIEVLLLDENTGAAAKAAEVLVGLLSVDLPATGGAGLLWRRILEDKGVYEVFFKLCSWNGDELPGGKKSRTQGQGRLLEFVAKIAALDFDAVATSKIPEIDLKYTGDRACKGLLGFAARYAVNIDEDVMMHMVLLDFYNSLLQGTSTTPELSSKALRYLQESGLHGSTVGRYLAPEAYSDDMIDQQFLESKAGEYIATFARLHPITLISSPAPTIPNPNNRNTAELSSSAPEKPLVAVVLERIRFILENNSRSPHTPSLDILSSLPISVLTADAGKRVVALVPISPPFLEYIDCLCNIFSKPGSDRSVYDHYHSVHPEMWRKIVSYASALALRDVVLSCMRFIERLSIVQDSGGIYWGIKEVVRTPGVMSFLITPPQRFAGAARDPMSAAYTVAARKLEVLETILRVLGRAGSEVPGAEGWRVVVEERLKVGLWGNAAGGEVATMEM